MISLSRIKLILFILVYNFLMPTLVGQDEDELDTDACMDCHDEIVMDNSIHEEFDCGDCHSTVIETGIDHGDEGGAKYRDVCSDCSDCHEDASEEWIKSVHGVSLIATESEKEAAHCWSCHGSHNILPSDLEESKTYPLNLASTCGECHAKPELVEKYNIPNLHPVELFSKSYHAIELTKGNTEAATCNDCHKYHDIKKGTDPTSSIDHSNIAETCGECHTGIYQEYKSSVHWKALTRGERESPACVDCHGEHEIVQTTDPRSPVSKRQAAEETCARCHQNERLIQKYGLGEGKISSYQDSYHGLAVLKGNDHSATCFDCHKAHAILDEKNPRSSIHTINLRQTCAKCHEGATNTFAQSYSHQSVLMAERPVEWYVKIVYIYLIFITIGGMILHNGIIFIGHVLTKYNREKSEDYIQRYTKSQIIQHYILMLSFIALVITGFALKFPQSIWVKVLTVIGMDEILRSLLHRIAAVLLIALSFWHIVELIILKSGRQFFATLLPKFSDLREFIQTMNYFIFRNKRKPEYYRFDYTEKVEYWALIWGTIIMVVSGFILWFPEWFGRFQWTWLIKVAEVFHYYEAWLATLAIIIWHLFFVLFHPKEYPMSMTWLHGRMSVTEYKEKHIKDYKYIMAEVEAVKEGKIKINQCCFQAKEYIKRHNLVKITQ